MKCWVFSIGETTTELCCELLKEYGFEVILFQDNTSLWEKMKRFYTEALECGDDVVMRIDADIIPNKYVCEMELLDYEWFCAEGFDWYSQNKKAISIHIMSRGVIELCNKHIESAKDKNRPESHLWRIPEINKHTAIDCMHLYGLHGYAQGDQRHRIKALKESRSQGYDWKLVERIEDLNG